MQWPRVSLLLLAVALSSCCSPSRAQCPSSATAAIWPSGQGMYALDSAADSLLPSGCCFYKWVLPTAFGAEGDVLAALNGTTTPWCSQGNCGTEPLCTSAVTLEELSEAAQQGKVQTVSNCGADCDAWGPPLGDICCRGSSLSSFSIAPSVNESVVQYHSIPWIPVELCPLAGSSNAVVGYDLDLSSSLDCPADLSQGSPQKLVFTTLLSNAFENELDTYVLAFHRKLHLDPMSVSFELVDSRGSVIVPKTDVTFGDDSSAGKRRKLLKGRGGGSSGGGRSTSSGRSSYSSSSFSSSSGSSSRTWTPSFVRSSKTGTTYYSKGSYSYGTRYTNSKSYVVPYKSDFTSGNIARGTPVASTSGGGVVYWGSQQSRAGSYYYGAPDGFGRNWYPSGGYSSYGYGYSGPSYWRYSYPIFIWGRPFGCGYHCHYHHHRYHDEEASTKELRTLYLTCDMVMDLLMESAFKPTDYTPPFTLNVYSVDASVSQSTDGECADRGSINATSTPESPGLYATLVRVEEVDVLSSTSSAPSSTFSPLLGMLLAATASLSVTFIIP